MKAAWYEKQGAARDVLVVREMSDPQPLAGEVRVVNLAPREMAGMISEGMLFDIGYSDGITPVLAVPETHVPEEAERDNADRRTTLRRTDRKQRASEVESAL